MPQKYKPKKPRKLDNALIFSKGPYGELAKGYINLQINTDH